MDLETWLKLHRYLHITDPANLAAYLRAEVNGRWGGSSWFVVLTINATAPTPSAPACSPENSGPCDNTTAAGKTVGLPGACVARKGHRCRFEEGTV